MSDNNDGLYVRLFTEREEPEDYERYIHGPEPDSDTIGKALKRFSDDSGITQGQISLLTGISRSCLYYYCKDQRKIGYENLILLCVALKVNEIVEEFTKNFGNENGKSDSSPMAQQTVKEYFDMWLTAIKPDIARTTHNGYRNIIRKFTEYLDKEYPDITLGEMNRVIIQDYLTKKFNSGLKGKSIKQYYLALHSAFTYAVKMEILENHPMDKMTLPRAERYEASFYNQDEINTLFKVFEGDPLELIVHIAAYYGLRRCEILGLRWDAIDFQNKTITIQRKIIQVYDDDGVERLYVENRLKTNSTRRTLPLIPHIEEMLLAKKKTDEYFRKSFGKEYDTEYDGFICRRPDGKIIEPNYLTSHFGYIIKSRGMRHLRFHDLRHSCASLLLANDVPMKAIQEWLGHSNFSITANLYSHLEYNAKIASANTIARVLGGAETKSEANDTHTNNDTCEG